MGQIKKVLLMQPNYSVFGKRIWDMIPYSLGLLNASIKKRFESDIYDPNFEDSSDEKVAEYLRKKSPDVIGISSVSTDYHKETEHMTELVRKTLPDAKIILGGVIPTVSLDLALKDKNVDYFFVGEGETRIVNFLEELNKTNSDFSSIEGIAYNKDGKSVINRFEKESRLVQNLDSIPFPDYGSLDAIAYGSKTLKYSAQLIPEKYPFALTSTSRGCPFHCTFCSGWTVSGRKVRMRSSENVLKEIDGLYNKGFKEIIFLDDHFFFDKKRAEEIMDGIIQRNYDLSWKCVNVNISNLNEKVLEKMRRSGSYQITVSIESGNEKVLKEMIKKPFIDLKKAPSIINQAKDMGFEVISNFIIGYPEETWDQIRETFKYADGLNVDYAVFHIATPLPETELMKMCKERGVLEEEFERSGFCQPIISTKEFTIPELRILRAFEWDRINFSSEERKKRIAKIQGISIEEVEQWRKDTRRKLGVKIV